ncbi:MAG: IS110 family transposase [Pseudonocardiaceae bacterium]|nr:IS110 family transposase [Pseudonocardiaceae bacterium]
MRIDRRTRLPTPTRRSRLRTVPGHRPAIHQNQHRADHQPRRRLLGPKSSATPPSPPPCSTLGAPLLARLAADDVAVIDVPAKLAARVRLLSAGHGRKNDDADAVSVAIAAHTAPHLRSAEIDQALGALRVLVEHRDDLVKTRTQLVNRLHGLLTELVPAGAGHRRLTVEIAADLLRRTRPREPARRAVRRVAVELVAELRRLERRISSADAAVATAVEATGSTLTELYGIGLVLAGKILARVGPTSRFRSASAFASFTGTAPIEVSSGEVVRHRLSRAGDRGLNHALHMMALTQIQGRTSGRAYYQRKRAEGKSHKEAMRCLKRRLSDVVYRRLRADNLHAEADPGRTREGGCVVQRDRLSPRTPALRTSHFPGPHRNTTTPPQDHLDTERGRPSDSPGARHHRVREVARLGEGGGVGREARRARRRAP